MKEILIVKQEQPIKLKAFLAQLNISGTGYKKLKTAQCLTVNEQIINSNILLAPGDKVALSLPPETSTIIPEQGPLKIVYEDDGMLLVDKPAPLLTHPTVAQATGTLANLVAGHFVQNDEHCGIHPVSRLDRNTSGLVLFAKNAIYHYLLSQSHIEKEYLGIVEGEPAPHRGIITAPLSRKPGSIIEREVDFQEGKTAVTAYEVMATNGKISLVRFKLQTGRTHQIRVHCAYLGCPLVGDHLYGQPGPQGRHLLHAFHLSFLQPFKKQEFNFTIGLPNDILNLIKSSNLCYNESVKY
jgi:23S rRNA pseudouridine1911/1915/1917 synthase